MSVAFKDINIGNMSYKYTYMYTHTHTHTHLKLSYAFQWSGPVKIHQR
jgi:hypothetical protein